MVLFFTGEVLGVHDGSLEESKFYIILKIYRIRRCLVSPKQPSLCQTRRGGLDKGDLYLGKFTFKKISINNTWVNQIFIICYDFIKYNSYVNLDDGNHIGIVWSVVMQ